MDLLLRRRYEAAVSRYESSDSAAEIVAAEIRSALELNPVDLRPDARQFLLVNFTELIFRAYSEPLRDPLLGQPGLLPPYRDFTRNHTIATIGSALRLILDDLPPTPTDGASAHAIMGAIERLWPKLSPMFGWG